MKSLQFAVTGTGVIVPAITGLKVVFYGVDFVLGGTVVPTSVQFSDGAALPFTPDLNGLLAGVIHSLPVMYTAQGFPVPREVGGVGLVAGIAVTGGTAPTVRGTYYYDYVQ